MYNSYGVRENSCGSPNPPNVMYLEVDPGTQTFSP